jgi:hypothetical protein
MKTRLPICFVLGATLLIASAVFAHHGTQISYDQSKTITVSGTVTEWSFSFPHPSIFFDVTDQNGQIVKWGAELLPTPPAMKSWKIGWSKETLN